MAAWIAAVAALIAAVAAVVALFKIQSVHLLINSRMDEWFKGAKAVGRQDERDERKRDGL
jgi:hypothetical protein